MSQVVVGIQLSVMPQALSPSQVSNLVPFAQKLISEGGPTNKDDVEGAFDYFTNKAVTAHWKHKTRTHGILQELVNLKLLIG